MLIHRPMFLMVLMGLPLLFLAYRWKIFPGKRLLYLATLPAITSLLMVQDPLQGGKIADITFLGWLLIIVGILDGIVLVVAILDMLAMLGARHFSCKRNMLRIASQGKKHEVEIELTNQANRGCAVEIKDDIPDWFEADPPEFQTLLEAKSRTQFTYDLTSKKRGSALLTCIHLLVHSPLKLWRGFYQVPCESEINVYPDMKQITEYDLLARTNRLNLLGLRRSRKIGQDNEFERLRDYTQDDNYKHIDWRSTARRQKLTVRDFQSNQSQRIIFMVDCGRMMTGKSDGITLLDHSLNAMLMLSYVALRQGDSVGMISFSDRIHNYTPPKSGLKHVNRLLHVSCDQHANYVESRYDDAFLYLRTHCLKRSLVVLVTNLIDEINSHQIHQYMGSLSGRHLPLAVLLRDHALYSAVNEFEETASPSKDSPIVYEAAAAVDVLNWRQQVISDLRHQGVLALDVFPEQLTSEMINQYLEIKARHLL